MKPNPIQREKVLSTEELKDYLNYHPRRLKYLLAFIKDKNIPFIWGKSKKNMPKRLFNLEDVKKSLSYEIKY